MCNLQSFALRARYYYDEPDYDGVGYNGYYAPEGNTQNGYYASEGTTQNDAASREDMAPEEVTEGTIKDTPKSVQNESVGFAAKYASEAQGKALDPEVANNIKFLVTTKLSEKIYGDMLEKYETPTNCNNLCVPKVNAPIWDSLQPKTRTMDLKIQRVERSLVKGIMAFTQDLKDPNDSQQDTLTCLSNALFEMNMLRRDLIKPDLNSKFAQPCKPEVQTTEYLFGDDLSKHIKDLSEVHKATDAVGRGRGWRRGRFQPYPTRGRGAPFLGQARGGFSQRLPFKRARGRGRQNTQQ